MASKIFAVFIFLLPNFSNAESPVCKELKKINNLDELLYQFYINLDSDCLFTMPVEQLEEIWGIKIDVKGNSYMDFQGKPYKSDRDLFYVEKYTRGIGENLITGFIIKPTHEVYKKFGTLFPEGNFPKLLPPPIIKEDPPPHYPAALIVEGKPEFVFPPEKFPKHFKSYKWSHSYYWLNSQHSKDSGIMYMSTYSTASVDYFVVENKVISSLAEAINLP